MKTHFLSLIVLLGLLGCHEQKEISSVNPENWSKRTIDISKKDSL